MVAAAGPVLHPRDAVYPAQQLAEVLHIGAVELVLVELGKLEIAWSLHDIADAAMDQQALVEDGVVTPWLERPYPQMLATLRHHQRTECHPAPACQCGSLCP
jgi:hypothetical protein